MLPAEDLTPQCARDAAMGIVLSDWPDWSVRSELQLDDGSLLDVTVSETETDSETFSRSGRILITHSDVKGSLVGQVTRPLPGEGYAGGGTLLSASQRYLVLHYYSGQSQEAFLLLDLSSGLELVAAPPYFGGEVASYAFSPGETRLLMALPLAYGDWWTDREHEDPLERDDDGSTYVEFATMVTCDCASGDVWLAPLVVVPDITEPPPETYDSDLDPRFVDETTVQLSMPWGEATVVVSDPPTIIRVVNPLA